jgi:hypothetical protein
MPIKPDDKEEKVKAAVKVVLKAADCWWFMPGATAFGKCGVPDFVGCYRGKFFGVETKRPSVGVKGLTPLQQKQGAGIQKAKGTWFVVYDEETLALLKEWLS